MKLELESSDTINSGCIKIENNKILIYGGSYSFNSEYNISDIKIIGEYTNGNGPMLDDWFFVLIVNENVWNQVSFYADGLKEVMEKLSLLYNYPISGKLTSSTTWKSNVIWPNELLEQEFLKIGKIKPKSFLERIDMWIGTVESTEVQFTDNVVKFLQN